VCISGRSGSGKSSLIATCAGLAGASEGELSWKGDDMLAWRESRWDSWRRDELGYLDQDSVLLDELRCLENVLLPIIRPRPTDARRALDMMAKLGIGDAANAWPRTLSGGERQRVGIARATARSPAVLMLDEPTASLDRKSAFAVLDVLGEARAQGAMVLVASHDQLVLEWSDYVIRLDA
jgi:ABC-type lipoprotein export system ATPase subunit